MALREIIKIDEEKCDGCALCVPACAEGALKIIDGKAKLISEVYCDGMGACLGECPQDAITIEKREAAEYDEQQVEQHLQKKNEPIAAHAQPLNQPTGGYPSCPGAMSRDLKMSNRPSAAPEPGAMPMGSGTPLGLANWPIQLMLVPTKAPYFENADLVIAADCVPFAYSDFDRSILKGKALIIACPKLDNVDFYTQKLETIFDSNNIRSITIAFMEVPCCFGLVGLINQALENSGREIPVKKIKLGIRGEIQSWE